MKTIVLCLSLVVQPSWSGQSDKPSPFDVKKPIAKDAQPQPDDTDNNTGMATFYRASSNSRNRTASGEAVDDDDLSAAHMTLPLGSRVRVLNLANGRSVVVRITDRGTFSGGRIISVSYRAAKELDFLKSGTARVRLEPADK